MTIGKSGELYIACGGVNRLGVTVNWEERVDTAAKSSSLVVTGIFLTAGELGQYRVGGTFGVGGAVIGRLREDSCTVDVTESGIPVAVGGDFPFATPAIGHAALERAVLTVQLAGTTPAGQRFYGSGELTVPLSLQPCISEVTAVSGVIGEPVKIAVLPVAEQAVHTLRYEFGEMQGIIGTDLAGGSYTWTPPMDLCQEIPNSKEGDCAILCDTYVDGVSVGSGSCAITLQVPSNVGLRFGADWLKLVPANEGTVAEGLDCYVQGISRVQAVFDAEKISYENAYGGQAQAFMLQVNGAEYGAPYVSDVLHGYGEIPVAVTVWDSRQNRYHHTAVVTVLPYAPPALGDVAVFRCAEDGTAKEQGDCLSVTVGCSISSLGGRNSGSVCAKLRAVGGSWSAPVVLSRETAVLWAGEIFPDATYEVLLEAADALGNTTSVTVTLPCTNVFFHGRKGGRGAAFGKAAEADDVLEVAWTLKTKGDLVVEGAATIGGKALWEWLYPVGAVCGCGGDVDPATIYGGTWAETAADVRHWVRIA